MPSRTLRAAEKKALGGKNESQDTLVVFDHLMRDLGVGITSSSPPPEDRTTPPPSKRAPQQDLSRQNKPQSFTTRSTTRQGSHGSQSCRQQRLAVDTAPSQGPQTCQAPDSDGPSNELPDTLPSNHNLALEINTVRRDKMESQKSTQSNNGRSYDQYCRSPSPNLGSRPQGLGEDAGTVQFNLDKINEAAPHHGTHLPDDSGFVDFGLSRLRKHSSRQPTQSSPRPPETPAPPQNPFRHSRSQLLPPSQLFQSTQFSSAVKVASPTSSRPSPAEFPHPPLATSSPLKHRGLRSSSLPPSSPRVLPGSKSSNPENRPSSPSRDPSYGNAVAPESPQTQLLPRRKTASEPMTAYEPMDKSQERRHSSEVRSDPPVTEEDDEEEALLRRRRAKNRKQAGLKSLNAISIVRPARQKKADIEVPLTSSEKQKTQAEAYIAQCHSTEVRDAAAEDEETIKDSQAKNLPSEPKQNPILDDDDSTQSDNGEPPEAVVDLTPVAEPELPAAPSRRSGKQVEPPALVPATSRIPETSPPRAGTGICEPEQQVPQLPAPIPEPAALHSTPPALNTRSTRSINRPRPGSSSGLSSVASTPVISTVSTKASVSDRSVLETSVADNSSPAATKTKRRSAREKVAKPKVSTESLRHSTRLESRRGSSSTDEIARALSVTPAFDQSLRVSRLFTTSTSRSASKTGRLSIKSPIGRPTSKLFDGMAFAISFQSKKPGETNDQYKSRMESATALEKRIAQAGGKVLANGFDELFELSPGKSVTSTPVTSPAKGQVSSEIQLTSAGYATGFTALIADGHSRKVKYMQALALGLPCIAPRWVTMCLDKEELVDWSSFLLCAGQSAFLGDAIRSRSLAPYDPATARLADVVAQRTKLLRGSRILAVVKRSVESKKMAYVFLARVLGASLVRAYTVDEAKVAVKAAEEAGQPFDWVYVDGKSVEQALFSTASTAGGNKKRKRVSMPAPGAENNEPPLKKIRTLDDELVIQSLILGRLIEEGEMEQ
ncbi:putative DNA repair protein [Triangularia verruculosa]|uniref:DNA repair protein n=1 Tax=Triangularia verruculosa TaxID=2587418 RepID=A0AAN7AWD1_9PEZI|nr:putative DNA repair protein [Triangularia verruculosa]